MNRFEEIYSENYKTMVRVARKMIGDRDDVSDIVQDIFLDLFNKLNGGYVILNPRSWLCRATANRCIDNLRRKKNFREIDSIGDVCDESRPLENQEIRDGIARAVSRLKPQERALITLYSEGLSYKEIAEATGIRFSSVGKSLSRTLGKIGEEIKKQGYELY